jgi:DNA relaxase NicK
MTLVTRLPIDDVLARLSELLDDMATGYAHGFNGYKNMLEFHKHAVRVGFSDDRLDVCVVIHGEACRALDFDTLLTIPTALEAKPTRVDLCIDNCPFTPSQFFEHVTGVSLSSAAASCDIEHAFTRAQKAKYMLNEGGGTCYIGSRQSPRMARIYNQHGFTRFELEVKRDAAVAVLNALWRNSDDFAGVVAGIVRDFINPTRQQDQHLERRHRHLADWWASFLGGFARARLRYTEIVTTTYEKFMDWAERSLPAVLRCYQRAAEFDRSRRTLIGLVQLGDGRLQPKHHRMIHQAKIAGLRFQPRSYRL